MYIKHEDKIADAYLQVIGESTKCHIKDIAPKSKVVKEEAVAVTPVISDDIMEDDGAEENPLQECWCTELKAALEGITDYTIEYNEDENILEVTDPNGSSALKAEIEMIKDNAVLITCVGLEDEDKDYCEEFDIDDAEGIAEAIREHFAIISGEQEPEEDAYTGKATDEAQTIDISAEYEQATKGGKKGKVAEAVAPKAGDAALPKDRTGPKGWLTDNDAARKTSGLQSGVQSANQAKIPNTGSKTLRDRIDRGLPIPVEEFAQLSADDQIKYIININYKVKPTTKAGKVFDYKSKMKPETRYWYWEDMSETGATKMKERWEKEAAAQPKDKPTGKDFGTPVAATEETLDPTAWKALRDREASAKEHEDHLQDIYSKMNAEKKAKEDAKAAAEKERKEKLAAHDEDERARFALLKKIQKEEIEKMKKGHR